MQTDEKRTEADRGPSNADDDASGGEHKPSNVAPDAVKDPNEKTGGKPGVPPGAQGGETDPGGS